jgi:glutathione-regulated potassium-efflux system ancillary protein KefG
VTAAVAARVLVCFAHPARRRSRVQVALADAARQVPGVTFHDLYEAYPDLDIDVDAEQARLSAHEVVVLQYPFFWYAAPPIVPQWFDLVLEHGWAYGSQGTALAGKRGTVAISTGGRPEAYGPQGLNRYTIDEFLRPVEATLQLCRVQWLAPFVVSGTHRMAAMDIAAAAQRYATWLAALVAGGEAA